VEVAGLEPASSKLLTGLLRAQPARESRAVTDHRPSATTPARKGFPSGTRAGPSGKPLFLKLAHLPSSRAVRAVAGATYAARATLSSALAFAFVFFPGFFTRTPGSLGSLHLPRSSESKPSTPSWCSPTEPIMIPGLNPGRDSDSAWPGRPPAWRRARPWPGACPTAACPGPRPARPWPPRSGSTP
jgi:hypothetical protein